MRRTASPPPIRTTTVRYPNDGGPEATRGIRASTTERVSEDGEAAASVVPSFVGPYRVIHELGRGGMGVVYEAEQQTPKRSVALKVLHAAGSTDALRVPDIKVLDFGLAYMAETDVPLASLVSSAGQVCGTAAYMSPEQVRGNPDEIDIRADVYSLGVLVEAEALCRTILEFDRRTLGPRDVNVGIDLTNLGGLLRANRQIEESERVCREAVAIFEATESAWLGPALGNLGETLLDGRRYEEADSILRKGVALGLKQLGENSQDVAKVRVKYGTCLARLGRYPEAEVEARAALTIFRNSLGESNHWTERSRRLLAEVQER